CFSYFLFCVFNFIFFIWCFFFFFQAEDGIRDRTVTGVQTCALPICGYGFGLDDQKFRITVVVFSKTSPEYATGHALADVAPAPRSEERRVGKECRSRRGQEK